MVRCARALDLVPLKMREIAMPRPLTSLSKASKMMTDSAPMDTVERSSSTTDAAQQTFSSSRVSPEIRPIALLPI